jgi:tripartite-type tricarboxylate transporter receptor subunit TctC
MHENAHSHVSVGSAYLGDGRRRCGRSFSSGAVHGLAIARTARLPEAPDLPAFVEAGLPDFEANGWYSIHGPAGLPPAIVMRLNSEIVRISNLPDIRDRLRQLGTETIADNTPERLTDFVRSEIQKYNQIIKTPVAE